MRLNRETSSHCTKRLFHNKWPGVCTMLCEAGEPAVSSEMFTSSLSTSEPEDAWCLIPCLLHDCGSFIFRTRMFMALFCWDLSLEDSALHKLFYQEASPSVLLHPHGLWEGIWWWAQEHAPTGNRDTILIGLRIPLVQRRTLYWRWSPTYPKGSAELSLCRVPFFFFFPRILCLSECSQTLDMGAAWLFTPVGHLHCLMTFLQDPCLFWDGSGMQGIAITVLGKCLICFPCKSLTFSYIFWSKWVQSLRDNFWDGVCVPPPHRGSVFFFRSYHYWDTFIFISGPEWRQKSCWISGYWLISVKTKWWVVSSRSASSLQRQPLPGHS